jgi:cyclohexanone monooxygenase
MTSSETEYQGRYDAVVVGAGFGGLYALYKLRSIGLTVRVLESASDVGGTWYWNRYPGARCDVESVDYSYSFSPEFELEWHWTSRYATQPEILSYLRHVADRFDLRRDIDFDTRVVAAHFDDETARWMLRTDRGAAISAQFCIMATGCLSTAQTPDLPGADSYRGNVYHTGAWPGPVRFDGQAVGVIGTGSSGIQVVPMVAEQAKHLYVFQRTPNFSTPAHDRPLDHELEREVKAHYAQRRAASRDSLGGLPLPRPTVGVTDVGADERRAIMERAWEIGGNAMQVTFKDLLIDKETNHVVSEFMRSKIREIVKDPVVAELLCPKDYPFGAKRVCKDTNYYETFNRENVTLVDLRSEPIVGLYESGLRTAAEEYRLDTLIFATGFDAMTGTLLRIDIVGREGIRLADEWAGGPQTYLGLTVAGFPNMFIVTGPGSPSVLTNMVMSIEQHIDWIARCIGDLRAGGHTSIEASQDAQSEWVTHTNDVAARTLYMKASSWYIGANIEGKPNVFMPYVGGFDRYRHICEDIAGSSYKGFVLKAPTLSQAGRSSGDRSPELLSEPPQQETVRAVVFENREELGTNRDRPVRGVHQIAEKPDPVRSRQFHK